MDCMRPFSRRTKGGAMKPTTLAEALSVVPTHWLLIPGVDVPRKGGDEIRVESRREWLPVEDMLWDFERAYEHGVIARRSIPQDVRESAAWWLLYNTLAEVDPIPKFDQLMARFIITMYGDDDNHLDIEPEAEVSGMRSFNGESKAFAAIKALGGEQRIIKELSAGPDPLGRWVLAGKP